MADKERNWVKVADFITDLMFKENGIAEVTADGKKLCIAQYKNELFAFALTCPHAGGFFSNGYIDVLGNVVCPLHRYKFCIQNGHNVTGEGYHLKNWPVTVQEEGVFVGLEKNKLFGLL